MLQILHTYLWSLIMPGVDITKCSGDELELLHNDITSILSYHVHCYCIAIWVLQKLWLQPARLSPFRRACRDRWGRASWQRRPPLCPVETVAVAVALRPGQIGGQSRPGAIFSPKAGNT